MTSDRYLFTAAISGVPDPRSQKRAAALAHEYSSDGAQLRCGPQSALVVSGLGWIVGPIFRRNGPLRSIRALDSDELAVLDAGDAGSLTSAFWGNYVAILKRPQGWTVLRAPVGVLPCYFLCGRTGFACASDPTLLVEAGEFSPEIDWSQVARTLYWTDLPSSETALVGLRELLPGTCATVLTSGSVTVQQCWSPWAQVHRPTPTTETVHRVVGNSVAALISSFRHPLLGLSGGLDSSIIAACLARRRDGFSALTVSTRDGGGDERHYARLAAAAARAPLLEAWYELEDVDLDRSVARHQPRPVGWIHEQAYHRAVEGAAGQCGADVFVSGNGGDNTFYNSHSARPVLDRILASGLSAGLFQTVNDVAEVTDSTWWQVVREAWRIWRSVGRGYRWRRAERFLDDQLASALAREQQCHPWLEVPRDALPARSGHVAMLLRMQYHLDSFDRAGPLPIINPLAVQPIIEMCLAIPSWQMVRSGRDRWLARSAFAHDLPPEIAYRRGKGSPDGFTVTLFAERADAIRDRLLGGQLVSRRLVKRSALETTLKDPQNINPLDRPRLLSLLDTEAWLNSWQQR